LRAPKNLEVARSAMGIDWMEWDELTQAIPPAYTNFIGKQLMDYIRSKP
jgi:DNA (cytosine-5)-methyltransferase 1